MSKYKLNEIINIVLDDLDKVDERLIFHTSSGNILIDQPIQYILDGGKKIRPILLLLSAKSVGEYDADVAYDLSAAVELIHVASLLHDDVIDNAEFRRGKESIYSKWDAKTAILLGDMLNAKVLEILNFYGDRYVLSVMSNAIYAMCKGEIIHNRSNENLALSKSEYIDIVKMKTGRLIAASSLIGAHIAVSFNAKDGQLHSANLDAYHKYGINFGIAFQIADDLLDLEGKKEVLGKLPFNDLREGKISYPYIILIEECDENELEKLKQIMINSYVDDEVHWIINLVNKYNVKEKCRAVGKRYADNAKLALSNLPDSEAKIRLERLADYVISREK